MKQDILVCALFSNQFTANYSIIPEFPLIKTMLISDYLLSNEEIIVKGSSIYGILSRMRLPA